MKKSILAIILISALLTSIVAGQMVKNFFIPQQTTIGNLTVEIFIDDVQWINNTLYDWGIMGAGCINTISNFTVVNTSAVPINVTLHTENLPTGWSITWAMNRTIVQPTTSTYAPLQLTTALDAIVGQTYTWSMYMRATES